MLHLKQKAKAASPPFADEESASDNEIEEKLI
jgi:hypothetical protein